MQPTDKMTSPETTAPPTCPRCGSPRTNEGQPSSRWHYSCGSYLYEGAGELQHRTDICQISEAIKDAAKLFRDIMRDEVNAQDEAEKWLRAFAPEYLTAEYKTK